MKDFPQSTLTRRVFLQAGTAALGTGMPVVTTSSTSVALAKAVLAPLAPIEPAALNPLLVDNIVSSVKEMLFPLFKPQQECGEYELYRGYRDDFFSFSLGAVRLLALNPR